MYIPKNEKLKKEMQFLLKNIANIRIIYREGILFMCTNTKFTKIASAVEVENHPSLKSYNLKRIVIWNYQ